MCPLDIKDIENTHTHYIYIYIYIYINIYIYVKVGLVLSILGKLHSNIFRKVGGGGRVGEDGAISFYLLYLSFWTTHPLASLI